MIRLLLMGTAVLCLGACDASQDNEVSTTTEAAASESAIAASASSDSTPTPSADPAPLLSDTLHDIELPEVGRLRLSVDGEHFEAPIQRMWGSPVNCKADSEMHPRHQQQVFEFTQEFESEDGRHIRVHALRIVTDDEDRWHHRAGVEMDVVEITVEHEHVSRLSVRRAEPGSQAFRAEGLRNAGDHDMPLIRARHGEQIEATAIGVLYPSGDSDNALTGPFELAVVCP